jgi:hypothetical protein
MARRYLLPLPSVHQLLLASCVCVTSVVELVVWTSTFAFFSARHPTGYSACLLYSPGVESCGWEEGTGERAGLELEPGARRTPASGLQRVSAALGGGRASQQRASPRSGAHTKQEYGTVITYCNTLLRQSVIGRTPVQEADHQHEITSRQVGTKQKCVHRIDTKRAMEEHGVCREE